MSRVTRFVLSIGIAILVATPASAAPDCAALKDLTLADTSITSAEAATSGSFTPPGARSRPLENLPAYCAVRGVIKPTPRSAIQFEAWLPQSNWNGRLQVVGNGGLAGTISYPAMASALRDGFATASTDTG